MLALRFVNMAVTDFIATRLEPDEAAALKALAERNAHSVSAELRVAIRRHLEQALNDEAPTMPGERFEPHAEPGGEEAVHAP